MGNDNVIDASNSFTLKACLDLTKAQFVHAHTLKTQKYTPIQIHMAHTTHTDAHTSHTHSTCTHIQHIRTHMHTHSHTGTYAHKHAI